MYGVGVWEYCKSIYTAKKHQEYPRDPVRYYLAFHMHAYADSWKVQMPKLQIPFNVAHSAPMAHSQRTIFISNAVEAQKAVNAKLQ